MDGTTHLGVKKRRGRSNDKNACQIVIAKVNFISRGEKKACDHKASEGAASAAVIGCVCQNRHQNIGIVWPCSEICSEQGAKTKKTVIFTNRPIDLGGLRLVNFCMGTGQIVATRHSHYFKPAKSINVCLAK
jgi:hypothetical protein